MEKKRSSLPIILFISVVVVTLILTILINSVQTPANISNILSKINLDDGDINTNWEKYPDFNIELDKTFTITKSGIYNLYGRINDGRVIIDAGDDTGKVKLVLHDVEINSSDGPAIYVKSADDVVIETAEGTNNSLSDGEIYASEYGDKVNGAIYSMGDLSFYGEGTLEVVGNYQDGIVSKDDLAIRSGEITVTAKDDGIRGKDSVHITNGKISVEAGQDAIKSTNIDVKNKGFVYIEGGEIKINARDDAIHATTCLVVNAGKISIERSYEGLEGAIIEINGGDINVTSSDDGINATGTSDERGFSKSDGAIIINGGEIYVNAGGDGLDSNGAIYINGGNIVVDGPTNGANGALDSEESHALELNGGTLIAVGMSEMARSPDENSQINSVSVFFDNILTANTKVEIKNSAEEVVLSHINKKIYDNMVAGSEKLQTGEEYTIYVNDEKYETFYVEEKVTIVGRKNGMFRGGDLPKDNKYDRMMR